MAKVDRKTTFAKPSQLLAHAQKTARLENLISVILGLVQIAMTIALAYWVATSLHNAVYQTPFQLPSTLDWSVLFAILATRALASFAQSRIGNRASIKIRNYLRHWTLSRTNSLNIRLFPEFKVAEVSNLLTAEIDKQFGYFAEYVAHRKLAVFMPLAVVIATASVNWIVPMILLFTGPMMVVFMVLVGWKSADASRDNLEQLNRLGDLLTDRLKNLMPLQLAGTTQKESDQLFEQSEGYRKSTMKVLRIAFLSGTVLEFFSAISVALVAVYLGLFFLGKYDAGNWTELTLFHGIFLLMLAPEFYSPLRKMGALYHQKTDAETLAEHLIKLDNFANASSHEERQIEVPNLQTLHVRNLLSGSAESPLHKEVNFDLSAGQALLIKGASGSGKTTLLDTLAGLRPKAAGSILVNGQEIDLFRQESWFSQLGYQSQNAELLFGSIRENLSLGQTYSDEALYAALAHANASEVVRNLPEQLDYQISDSGGRLSGGQAQRIVLARVFLHQPKLLLLDEPTANLDEETANDFMKNLSLYTRSGGTLIMSSHLHADTDFFDQVLDLSEKADSNSKENVEDEV